MGRAPGLILRDPALRVVTAAVFLFGAWAGSIAPYQSLVAIERLGIGDAVYAAVLVVAALVAVGASVVLGILTDQGMGRRRVAMTSAGAMLAGCVLMMAAPGVAGFAVVHALLFPGAALFGQVFSVGRVAGLGYSPADQAAILAVIRAALALAFVLVAPLWSALLSAGADLLWIYPVLAVLAAAMIAVLSRLPARFDRDLPSGLGFRASVRELARADVTLRVLLLGLVSAAIAAYMVLIGLAFGAAGRPESDVSLFVGGVAGLEVPFMLALPAMLRIVSQRALITWGAVVYAGWLALLPLLAPTAFVWLLILPAALGGASILTLPIAYLQDLLADRPGAGAALLALQKVAGDGACAAAFAAGTALSGYGLAAALAAGFAVLGAAGLWIADRRRHPG